MGFPSEQIEGVYRNPMSEVAAFLETRHKDSYMVYNLCSERSYDPAKLGRRVQVFPFDDHNPPPLKLVGEFCAHVQAFMDEHADHVVAVHCKAGKGRTGVMISAQLLHQRMYELADDALAFYGFARTNDCEGVTIPSQRAYVHYYARLCAEGGDALRARLLDKSLAYALRRVRVVALRDKERYDKERQMSVVVRHPHRDDAVYTCREFRLTEVADAHAELDAADREEAPPPPPRSGYAKPGESGQALAAVTNSRGEVVGTRALPVVAVAEFSPVGCVVQGDVRVELMHRDEEICHFWFHTAMLTRPRLVRHKWQLDGPAKDRKHKKFSPLFRLELDFEQTEPPPKPPPKAPAPLTKQNTAGGLRAHAL